MNILLARLNSCSSQYPQLCGQITEVQPSSLTQITIKLPDQLYHIPLATPKILQVGVYFTHREHNKAIAGFNCKKIQSRTRLVYLLLPPRMMDLISNRLYQNWGRGRFIVIYTGELRQIWSLGQRKPPDLKLIRSRDGGSRGTSWQSQAWSLTSQQGGRSSPAQGGLQGRPSTCRRAGQGTPQNTW